MMVGPIRRKLVPTVCEGVYGKDGPNPLLVRRCADKWKYLLLPLLGAAALAVLFMLP